MQADAWFGARRLLDPVSDLHGRIQAASHLRREQNIRFRGSESFLVDPLPSYFQFAEAAAALCGEVVVC
jgi:hypothetical protein